MEARNSPLTVDARDDEEDEYDRSPLVMRMNSLTPEPIGPPPDDLIPMEVKDAASKIQRMFRTHESSNGGTNSSVTSCDSKSPHKTGSSVAVVNEIESEAFTSTDDNADIAHNAGAMHIVEETLKRRSSMMGELFDAGLESWEIKQGQGFHYVPHYAGVEEHHELVSKRKSHEEVLSAYAKHGKDKYLHDIDEHGNKLNNNDSELNKEQNELGGGGGGGGVGVRNIMAGSLGNEARARKTLYTTTGKAS
jgi:hypothetical protein